MPTSRPSPFLRLLQRSAVLLTALLVTAFAVPRAQALTAASLTPAALVGRTLTFTITQGTAPFETSGSFNVIFRSTTAYSIPVSDGNAVARAGTYTISQSGSFISITFDGYVVNNATVTADIFPNASDDVYSAFEMYSAGPFNKNGRVVFSGSGGTTPPTGAAPAITSATTATATVGTPFIYAITASPAATSYTNTGGNAPVAISPGSGLVTGTFTAAGTFTFSFTASNASGTSAVTTVTVTATGGAAQPVAPAITSSAALRGTVGVPFNYTITASGSPASFALTSRPAFLQLNLQTGAITGTPTAAGTYAFAVTAINAVGSGSRNVTLTVDAAPNAVAAAPYNLTGYRNRVGQSFQFTVTGGGSGAVWGTDVYTDDSFIGAAAVHAGVLRVGETRAVTIVILPGQASYPASSRNGVTTASWPAWGGSFSFAGAGAVTSADIATSVPAAAPGFVAGTGNLAVGGRLVCPVTVRGGGTYTYRWYLNGVLIPGATANPYVVESVTAANAGTYSADVTNALGTTRIVAGTVVVGSAGAPVFSLQPFNKVVAPGGTFALAAEASGAGNSFQWLRNGVALAGENGPILLRQNVNTTDAGTYAVRVTNSAGTLTSGNATVTLDPNASVITSISVRVNATSGQIVTPAFSISGTGKKRILLRAVGPTLSDLGFLSAADTMSDPRLTVFEGSTAIPGLANDNWAAPTAAFFAPVGAFPLTAGSRDAALVVELDAAPSGRGYTVQVTGSNGSSGIFLFEAYDLGNVTGASKFTSVSVLTNAGLGSSTLILGVNLRGNGQRTVLARGIGQKLADFGVANRLADPRLQVFDGLSRTTITNDNWSGADFVSELVQAAGFIGAFPLDNNSPDSATLALLEPGSYTFQVTGANSGTGNAIIEVYEVP